MEFDPSVQGRWKLPLRCLAPGVAVFMILGLAGMGWHGLNRIAGAPVCSCGVLFTPLSLAADERRRGMAWMALLLNPVLPGALLIMLLSLLR